VTIQNLGSIGELIAAIATVATLLYLAVQIRQNTSATRTNSAAADTQSQNSLSLVLAQDRELSRTFWTGLESRHQLDIADQRCFDAILNSFLMNADQSWRFHKERAIEDATWEAQNASLQWLASQPGFAEWWAIWAPTTPRDFAEVIEEAIRAESPISTRSLAAQQGAAADSA